MNRQLLGRSMRAANRGVGLVEIMVGVVIAMIAMLIMMQVFSVYEGQKRTLTFGADAQTNGAVALYSIEREARLAGYGLADSAFLDCPFITVWRQSRATTQTVQFAPFQINPPPAQVLAGDANTDVVAFSFGSQDLFVRGVAVDQPAGPAADLKVDNRAGFSSGDIVVGVQTLPGGATQCAVHEITNVPGGQCGTPSSCASDELIHGSQPSYRNYGKGCTNTPVEYNKAGGIPGIDKLEKTNGAKLFNLGPLPMNFAYAVRNNQLTVCDQFNTDCTQAANFIPIASDIVSLRAVYGKDKLLNDGTVDTWDRVTPANGAEWLQTIAGAIVVIARSPLKEKADADGVCRITTNANEPANISWLGQDVAASAANVLGGPGMVDISASDPEWQCYRYKLFQTIVPFRNLIWKP